jgi:hypothetical protein
MIILEFHTNIEYGMNIVKYKNRTDNDWHHLYIDIETLNLLIRNFGNCDSPTMPKIIELNYCGADISLICGNKRID